MKLIKDTSYYAMFSVTLSFSMMLFFACVLNGTSNAAAESGSSNGYVRIINKQSRKMLGVEDCSYKNGANVRQWEYTGEECQLWTLQKKNGYVRIVNKQGGKMLGVEGCSSKNGANVRQWEHTGEECQLWTLQKEHEYVRIINKQSGKMLGVEGCSSKNGANVRQWKHTGEECQLWEIIVD